MDSCHGMANVIDGKYKYMSDMLALQSQGPPVIRSGSIGPSGGAGSPLFNKLGCWSKELASHPDQEFARFIISGITYGFHIGFDYKTRLRPSGSNLLSVMNNPQTVQRYLEEELREGRMVGPLGQEEAQLVHVSPIGIIPKSHKPGKWRLIHDLSSPNGASINDGISPEWSSLAYVSLEQVVQDVVAVGPGALLAKLDIRSAYRIVPVHNEDRILLGLNWEGGVYVDCAFPFGLRSAPKIFNALADAIQWIALQKRVSRLYHYLDDFICVGPPDSDVCGKDLATVVSTCEALGVPIAEEKLEGPSEILTFLGIELDTRRMQMRLPQEKLDRLVTTIEQWWGRKAAKKKELQSLAGVLQHACTVVRPGRCFLRRIFQTMSLATRQDHWIRLNVAFRSDLAWWRAFLREWNGMSLLWVYSQSHPDVRVISDASGSWGCGARYGTKWLQVRWPVGMEGEAIHVKELIPIVLAAVVWGKEWKGLVVQFVSDNEPVVKVLASGYALDPGLMQLLRCLFFVAARFEFWFAAIHIEGKSNTVADAISRGDMGRCRALMPNLQVSPSVVPQVFLELIRHPEWTSQDWVQRFRCCLSTL